MAAAGELSPEQVHEACLRLLAARPRSRHELAQRLARRGADPEVVARVLDRLAEVQLVDDAAFARTWVQNRHSFSGKSRRALAVELRAKGVASDDAAAALEQVDPESERARAVQLVERKLRTLVVPSGAAGAGAAARTLSGMLARRGYPGELTRSIVAEALAARGAEPSAVLNPDSPD